MDKLLQKKKRLIQVCRKKKKDRKFDRTCNLSISQEEIKLAMLIGLLHDIG